jgi:LacI family transcriptional regulator
MATIRDVALRAGVSAATVSHVINKSRKVSDETRDKVIAAVESLKYRRDGIARSLRVSQTSTIGLMISDISNPFFAELVRGIEDAVHERGHDYNIVLCNTEESDERERRSLELVMEKRIDGLILVPTGGNRDFLKDLVGDSIPIVFVDRSLPAMDVDSVVVDNRDSAFRLVTHLIGLGHKRIAAMEASLNASSIRERMDGYRDAMNTAAIVLERDYVHRSRSTIDDAVAAGLALLDLKPRPTGVFCTNNFMTLGIVKALAERGLKCPEDVAVVGFDDFPWADAFRPRLTVVAQPGYALGQEAARLLFDRIAKKRTGPAVKLVLGTSFIVRESCGAELGRRP